MLRDRKRLLATDNFEREYFGSFLGLCGFARFSHEGRWVVFGEFGEQLRVEAVGRGRGPSSVWVFSGNDIDEEGFPEFVRVPPEVHDSLALNSTVPPLWSEWCGLCQKLCFSRASIENHADESKYHWGRPRVRQTF